MSAWKMSERRRWGAALGTLLLINLSAWPLQFVLDFLRSRNLLRLSMAALFVLSAAGMVIWLARRRAGWAEWSMQRSHCNSRSSRSGCISSSTAVWHCSFVQRSARGRGPIDGTHAIERASWCRSPWP
jgi:hypothetical protein